MTMAKDGEGAMDGDRAADARPSLASAYPALSLTQGPLEGAALADLADPSHSAWTGLLDWQQRFAPGVSARGEAALFLGQALFFLTIALCAQHFLTPAQESNAEMHSASLPTADAVALHLQPLEGEGLSRCVHLQVAPSRNGPNDVRLALEDLASPLIEGLFRRTRLGRAALWRVAGDGIALALLDLGRRTGRMKEAKQLFEIILKAEGSPFRNRHLAWPKEIDEVLERGGCCRIYESPGMPLCPSCVLQNARRGRRPGSTPV